MPSLGLDNHSRHHGLQRFYLAIVAHLLILVDVLAKLPR